VKFVIFALSYFIYGQKDLKKTTLYYAETKHEPTFEWPNIMVLKL